MTHYDTLGVPSNASDDEIKRAYRALSLKHHPDRGGDKAKFQEISAANDILSDPDKRRQYDFECRMGAGGDPISEMFRQAAGGGGVRGGGPVDIFSALFGMGLGGHDMGPGIHIFHGGHGGPEVMFQRMNSMNMNNMGEFAMKPPPINITISMNLQQAFSGMSYPVEINRWVIQGDQKVFEKEVIYIPIPPGIDEREMIEIHDKGHIANPAVRGDVRISVEIENNTEFQRRGLDLHYRKVISLKEALCGFTFEIIHLNGKRICMNNTLNTSIIRPNSQKFVPDMGMIRGDARGKLVIEFEVEFPTSISEEQKEMLMKVL